MGNGFVTRWSREKRKRRARVRGAYHVGPVPTVLADGADRYRRLIYGRISISLNSTCITQPACICRARFPSGRLGSSFSSALLMPLT